MGRVVAIGECLVELALRGPRDAIVGYGGDGLAAAIYLSRAGASVSLATALGRDDPFSVGVLKLMADEGVDASLVVQASGRIPGLYVVPGEAAATAGGLCWRGEAPMHDFFALVDEAGMTPALLRTLRQAVAVWVSGVTLANVGEAGRGKLMVLLAAASHAGAQIFFDVAYRPELWASPSVAAAAASRVLPLARYVAMGPSDRALLGAWRPLGEAEAVERLEDGAVRIRSPDGVLDIRPTQDPPASTRRCGAREAFGAGYLAARLAGENPTRAVAAGRRAAEVTSAQPNAILPHGEPRQAMG